MLPLAGAVVLVLGGALAGCVDPGMLYDEGPAEVDRPVAAYAAYHVQLGCGDCRDHRPPGHQVHHEHREHKPDKPASKSPKHHRDERR